jgi:hypothetical protein
LKKKKKKKTLFFLKKKGKCKKLPQRSNKCKLKEIDIHVYINFTPKSILKRLDRRLRIQVFVIANFGAAEHHGIF